MVILKLWKHITSLDATKHLNAPTYLVGWNPPRLELLSLSAMDCSDRIISYIIKLHIPYGYGPTARNNSFIFTVIKIGTL